MSLYTYKHSNSARVRLLAGVWLAASFFVSTTAPRLAAAVWQDQSASSGVVPLVALAELSGTPGASLMVPLYFTPDLQTPLRSLTVDIEFVSNNLKFQKASRGVAAEQANVDITTSVTDAPADDKGVTRSKLRVTASLTGQTPNEGMPDGLLAYLLFQISLEAKPFAIKLTPTIISAEDFSNPPKKIAKVGTEPGLVTVEVLDVMPEATCFFFTH
ncbi:MAG: hypothetical protein HY651_01630 [Acidobacteria bacterium]|nr:hypothetical protein [Acidobacteriota bacterium]